VSMARRTIRKNSEVMFEHLGDCGMMNWHFSSSQALRQAHWGSRTTLADSLFAPLTNVEDERRRTDYD
jgi:hypothetical protein